MDIGCRSHRQGAGDSPRSAMDERRGGDDKKAVDAWSGRGWSGHD
jgi:hypothetical protein